MSLISSFTPDLIEVGVDEVGRGCLAGNVVACAVILPKDFTHDLLKDSKKIPKKLHASLAQEIKDIALAWAIAEATPVEIDKINILQATYLAMHRALDMLDIVPELILVDGNRFSPYNFIPHNCIVKGDNKFFAIAAASIIAKNYRDEQMESLSPQFPEYNWDKNVGYPTKKHKEAIKTHGFTEWHRLTFKV
jgi:ribonuclease HII